MTDRFRVLFVNRLRSSRSFKLQDAHDACHREAVILTNTWYFEGTVLFASFANFLVMAKSSKAVPPSTDLLAVILIGEIFVTLFLSFEGESHHAQTPSTT